MYSKLIIDSLNLGYIVFNNEKVKNNLDVVKIGNKKVYPIFVREFIGTIKYLETKFLDNYGQTTLLFDNYTSRDEMRNDLKPLNAHESRRRINSNYKAHREKAKPEFYNSMDLIHYYYKIGDPKYHTVRIPNLEADDLLLECIKKYDNDKLLFVSTDKDWAKGLSENADMLTDLYKEPFTYSGYIEKYGYEPKEDLIILDKILNGDESDNIKSVFPEITSEERKYIINHYESIDDFGFNSQFDPVLSKYSQLIKDREPEIKLAFQMLATVIVTTAQFKSRFTTGRGSKQLINVLNSVIFEKEPNSE